MPVMTCKKPNCGGLFKFGGRVRLGETEDFSSAPLPALH